MKDLIQALDAMRASLAFLDEVDAPAHIGAHLDLAICRLEEHVGAQHTEGAADRERLHCLQGDCELK